jgi:Cu+-exporting ATPase
MTMAAAESALVKDPVCGMAVDPVSAKHKAEHGGTTYYFCSTGCHDKFVAEPARFLAASTGTPPPTPAPSGAI